MTNDKHEIAPKKSFQKSSAQISKVERANKSLYDTTQKVKEDFNRPVFHFLPPSNWINDPNGLFYFKGYYHLFYQYNPHSDSWGSIHWGHARSTDLVHWEHLPIALSPSFGKDEEHCFSGCGFIRNDDKPILFYTSIGKRAPEQWAAVPKNELLIEWLKLNENPIIKMKDHDGQIIEDWRDPFIFEENNNTYMVAGGHPINESGSIMIYKALNLKLTKWKYLGIIFQGTDNNWECPNLFKLDNKYILIYSPHGGVKYYTGNLALEKIEYIPEYHGVIDFGPTFDYYAPNTLQIDNGRRITFGWIQGFKPNQGWRGAISLPRELSLDNKGRLLQKPIPELESLRSNKTIRDNFQLRNSLSLKEITYPQFELKASFGKEGTQFVGFRFNDEAGSPYEIHITPFQFSFGKNQIKIDSSLCNQIFNIQLFFDRTIIEIFINDGLLCATKVIYAYKNNLNFELICNNSNTQVECLEVWGMESI